MRIRMIIINKILDMNNRYYCESDKKITDRNNKDLQELDIKTSYEKITNTMSGI